MQATRILAAVLAAVTITATAPRVNAQPTAPLGLDLQFKTIASMGQSGHQNPEKLVIRTQADYAAFFNGNPPASPAVDFASEDVIAVAAGWKPTPGYGIEIVRIYTNTGGITGGMNFVEVRETK